MSVKGSRPGLYKYDGIECAGFDMNQVGFHIISCPHTTPSKVSFNYSNTFWRRFLPVNFPDMDLGAGIYGPIGFIALNGNVNIEARRAKTLSAYNQGEKVGDDFACNGVYSGSSTSGANYVSMQKGVIWGQFDYISMWKPASGTGYVKVIIGKWK